MGERSVRRVSPPVPLDKGVELLPLVADQGSNLHKGGTLASLSPDFEGLWLKAQVLGGLLGGQQAGCDFAIGGDGEEIADGVREVLEGYGFEIVEDLPFSLWQTAGKLKGTWKRVSLADCFALALALETSATLVTSDHHEMDTLAEAGVCPIRFIR